MPTKHLKQCYYKLCYKLNYPHTAYTYPKVSNGLVVEPLVTITVIDQEVGVEDKEALLHALGQLTLLHEETALCRFLHVEGILGLWLMRSLFRLGHDYSNFTSQWYTLVYCFYTSKTLSLF